MPWDLARSGRDKGHLCKVRYCRTPRRIECRSNGNIVTHSICTRCETKRWRANNPEKRILAQIRESARKRRIEFRITLADLQSLPGWANYLQQVSQPNTGSRITLDRKKRHLGYVPGNLQFLSNSNNVAKGNKERHDPF